MLSEVSRDLVLYHQLQQNPTCSRYLNNLIWANMAASSMLGSCLKLNAEILAQLHRHVLWVGSIELRVMKFEHYIVSNKCSALSSEHWMVSPGCWVLSCECRGLLFEFWASSAQHWALNKGDWVVSVECWALSSAQWAVKKYWLLSTENWHRVLSILCCA